MTDKTPSRCDAILQALVHLLETDPGARITAGLARAVGVTEAALYRHFPSKRKMLEALIEFAERNPGLCRVLTGEALSGENEALRKRTSQFFERQETEIRQILKEGDIRQNQSPRVPALSVAPTGS